MVRFAAVRFHFETYGCTMNHGESQDLMRCLSKMGHTIVSEVESTDVAVVNTCVVIAPTERKMFRRLHKLQEYGKRLVIIGCLASVARERLLQEFPGALVCGTSDYPSLPAILRQEFGVMGTALENDEPTGSLILPIAQGCRGSCTYCITKIARGDLKSYPIEELRDRAKRSLSQGVGEILVTSQDTAWTAKNAYLTSSR